MNLETWISAIEPRRAEFAGFQAGYSEGPNLETGQHYSAEPWSESEGSLYDLSCWFDTADEARAAASEASLRLGHSGIFDDLTTP